MILLADAGNSRLKWACLRDRTYEYGGVLPRGKQVAAMARKAWGDLASPPDRVIVACVAGGTFRSSLANWFEKQWSVTAEFPVPRAEAFGVRNAYAEPWRLGIDRWAALIAARRQQVSPVCIVDCGTAITIDALSAEGHHLGGLIAPGLNAMRDSLVQRAADIDAEHAVASGDESSLLASDTGNAIVGGSLYAAVSMIDRVVLELGGALGSNLRVVMTGGDAEQIMPLLESRVEFAPDLVLRGLAVMAADNESADESGREQEIS
jgi:type III pantothenate kinase